jgi:hypothetical protein
MQEYSNEDEGNILLRNIGEILEFLVVTTQYIVLLIETVPKT